MEPDIKLLMHYKKSWLLVKAKERGLNCNGTKFELAQRIAEKDSEDFTKVWKAISN